jgi:hypothetical protein
VYKRQLLYVATLQNVVDLIINCADTLNCESIS